MQYKIFNIIKKNKYMFHQEIINQEMFFMHVKITLFQT